MPVNKGPSSGQRGEGGIGGEGSDASPSQESRGEMASAADRLAGNGISDSAKSSPADPAKVSEWLKDADEAQCSWALRYLCNQVSLEFHKVFPGKRSRDGLVHLLELLLCGVHGSLPCGSAFPHRSTPEELALKDVTRDGARYFLKTRNVWNQRVNRARKAKGYANAIIVDADTKKKIKALASEHNLKEDEFLSIVVDLLHERRGSVEGIIRQRKAAKKAAIASDLGLLGESSM